MMNLQENIHRIKEVIGIIQEDNTTQLERQVFPSKDKGYHVTPDIYIEQIKREGLTPKSESKLTAHPERIYLYLVPNSSYKTLASDLLHSSKYKDQVKNYFVLEIDLTKLPQHKFYLDYDSSLMYVPVYTKQAIPPSAIKVIRTIPVGELPVTTLSSPEDDKESKEFWAKTNDDYEKEKEEPKNSVNKWDEIRKKLDAMGGTHSVTLNENIHRIKEVMGIISENDMGYIMLPMDDIRRPNGSVGHQGFTPESIIGLVRHISNVYDLNLPEYESLKDLIYTIREQPEIKGYIMDYVKSDPISVTQLPDESYHLKDGNHRANLLNLLYFDSVPAIIK